MLLAVPALSGAYIYAGEVNGVDLVTHPRKYSRIGGHISLAGGLSSAMPNATASDLEQPIGNAIVRWNNLKQTTGNLVLGSSNSLAANQIDYESVVVHELGHCLGLAHVNLASESGLSGPERNFTKATEGSDNNFNVSAAARGADDIRGGHDDDRGDDINLHWFNTANSPLVLETPVDSSRYRRDVADLPAGESFATNADRSVAQLPKYNFQNTMRPIHPGRILREGMFFLWV